MSAVPHHLTLPQRLRPAECAAIFRRAGRHAGGVVAIEEMRSGNVSHVYKVTGSEQTVFVKIRDDRFARMPSIRTDPALIRYEHRALELFGGLVPGVFPRILAFDGQLCCMILSDVFRERPLFEETLNALAAGPADLALLGGTLGRIHRLTRHVTQGLRPDGDQEFRANSLRYCLEDSRHPVLIELSARYRREPACHLIMGDPAPKNMGIGSGLIGICDLDNAHLGSHLYEVAYVMAHPLLHYLLRLDQTAGMLGTLLSSYLEEHPIRIDMEMLAKTIIGIMMYRLHNPVVPYRMALDTAQRLRFYHSCAQALYRPIGSIGQLVDALEA